MRGVLILLLVGPASAEPCKPAGGVFVEIDQRATAKVATATSQLYETGAFKIEIRDAGGAVARTQTGCLEPAKLDIVRTELRRASWKVRRVAVTCRADSPRFTVYTSRAQTLFIDRPCNSTALDNDSRQVLETIELYLHVPEDLDAAPVRQRPINCLDIPLAPGCL